MIYENIKRIALKKNMSIRAIELKAGLGNGVIGGWKTSDPTVTNLKAVADVLNVKIEDLLRENENSDYILATSTTSVS